MSLSYTGGTLEGPDCCAYQQEPKDVKKYCDMINQFPASDDNDDLKLTSGSEVLNKLYVANSRQYL
jgi:hypothetical protein